MEYVTAGYWQKEEHAGLFLSLQQRKYRKSGRNAVSACISDDGKIVRYLQDRIDDELSGKILWQTGREELLRECFQQELSALGEDCNYAGILCAEERVLLFSHGRMRKRDQKAGVSGISQGGKGRKTGRFTYDAADWMEFPARIAKWFFILLFL